MKRSFALGTAGTSLALSAMFVAVIGAAALTPVEPVAVRSTAQVVQVAEPVHQIKTTEALSSTAAEPTDSTPTSPVGAGSVAAAQPVVEIATPACPAAIGGVVGGAPSRVSSQGVAGTSSADLSSFAHAYNEIRVANCLAPVPLANFRYDSCLEDRLFWIAEDPSSDPSSAWGHNGTPRSDGAPAVGCDGNLAGGFNNTGKTVATKWWNSPSHRTSLFKPSHVGTMSAVCIYFAMTHGGVPDEPAAFARSAARWIAC